MVVVQGAGMDWLGWRSLQQEGPGLFQLNASLIKRFTLREGIQFQLRVEALGVTNIRQSPRSAIRTSDGSTKRPRRGSLPSARVWSGEP